MIGAGLSSTSSTPIAGTEHADYWNALYAEIENGGAEAMFHDLLQMDLSGFNVRAVPHTAAKAQQQAHSLRGVEAWVHHILQEAAIGSNTWKNDGLAVEKDYAYQCYVDFTKQQRDWRPDVKSVWSKKMRELLGGCVQETKQKHPWQNIRVRAFMFAPLDDCRRQFALRAGAPNMEWEPTNEEDERADAAGPINHDTDGPAKLQTPINSPKLAPETDTDLDFAPNGAAGHDTGGEGEPSVSPASQHKPAEDEPEDVE